MYQLITAQIAFSAEFPYLATVTGVASIAGILGLRWWKQKNKYKSLESFPSPPRHWFLGNIPQILTAVKAKKLFQLLFNWSEQLGSMYVYWIGYPVLILSKPKVIEETIINGMKDGTLVRSQQVTNAWNDIVGPIIIGQNGTEWQWRRKAWNPEFSSSSLSRYVDIISQGCEQVIETIKAATPSKEIQVNPLFIELTMRVISSLVIGIPIDKKTASLEVTPLDVPKVYEATSILTYRFLRVATGEKTWMKYLPTKNSRDYWSARKDLEDLIAPRVELALQMRAGNKTDIGQISSLFQESMLVKIAAKESKYNRKELLAETILFLIAGTDTTAHTLSFTVGELALNPRVFQKAQNIVDQVWQKQGSINAGNFKELDYISAILKETLRLYSVASGSASLAVQCDTIIEGKIIPRGTKIFWSMLAAGRDPEIYSHPDEFLPERWLDNKENSPLLMIDFGSGSHRCLGEHLSMLESTLMLSLLLRNFDWKLVNGRSSLENLEQNLLIYPSDKMPVYFQLRTHAPKVAKVLIKYNK